MCFERYSETKQILLTREMEAHLNQLTFFGICATISLGSNKANLMELFHTSPKGSILPTKEPNITNKSI